MSSKLLLFGGTGAIGTHLAQHFREKGWQVVIVSRRDNVDCNTVKWDPLNGNDLEGARKVAELGMYDAVCWAQGSNCNDSIYDVDIAIHEQIYRTNCLYTIASLNLLLRGNLLSTPARLCIVTSIWQNISRQNKLSYGVSKAACRGLVLSAANDLGRDGHLINAVLPGVIESPMARQNLSNDQIEGVESSTQFGRLPTFDDVVSAIYYLCSESNTGVTGQFIKVDLGFSDVRFI